MFPEYIPTRPVSVGGAMVLESAEMLKVRVTITASRSLVWDATGYRFERLRVQKTSGLGSEVEIVLPRTDAQGWRDPEQNAIIDVSEDGSYTHQYTATVEFLDANDRNIGVRNVTMGPFTVPAGTGAIDLDKTVPASTVAGQRVMIPDLWSELVNEAQAAAEAAQAALVDSTEFVREQVAEPGPVRDALNTANAVSAVTPGNAFYAALYDNVLFRLRNSADTFLSVTRRLNFFDSDEGNAKGSVINIDHWGDGSGDTVTGGQTYGLDIHNNPGAVQGILGHQYSSVTSFMKIDNTGSKPAIEIFNTKNDTRNPGSHGSGDAFVYADSNPANGAAATRFRVTGKGNVQIATPSTSTMPALGILAGHDTVQALRVEKTGTGSGNVFHLINRGTGFSALFADNDATTLVIESSGLLDFKKSSLVTSGATAGGGSPLPATPEGYLFIKINGTLRKVPFYAN